MNDAALQRVRDAFYACYPAYRAVNTITTRLEKLHGITITGRSRKGPSHQEERPLVLFNLRGTPAVGASITLDEWLQITLHTRTDAQRFVRRAQLDTAVQAGAAYLELSRPGPFFRHMVCVDPSAFDYPAAAEALASVLAETPLRKLIPRGSDDAMKSLLRRYFGQTDPEERDYCLSEAARLLDDGNLVAELGRVGSYNPWDEEDRDSTLGCALCILDTMLSIQGRRGPEIQRALLKLRRAFARLGDRARCDISEIDGLLQQARG